MTIVESTRPITGGVDTHLDVHVAAAVDANGGVLGVESFATTPAGCRELCSWLQRFGTVDRVGVEGTGAYGAGLARHFRGRGPGGDRGRSSEPTGASPQRQVRRARRDQNGAGGAVGPGVGDREVPLMATSRRSAVSSCSSIQLAALHIVFRHSRPYHPQTCGKVERFHQTLKKWLAKRPRCATVEELHAQLDWFANYYNTIRPHRSLGRRTPAVAFAARPKAGPPSSGPTIPDHFRVRHDTIDPSGVITLRHKSRLHHIGLGRRHAGQRVLVLVHDLEIRVLTDDGELLRALTLDPTPTTNARPKPCTMSRDRCARCLATSHRARGGIRTLTLPEEPAGLSRLRLPFRHPGSGRERVRLRSRCRRRC